MTSKVSGRARGQLNDDAERWLRSKDPSYDYRDWDSTDTDMLSRALSMVNEKHFSLRDLIPIGDGKYARVGFIDEEFNIVRYDPNSVIDVDDIPVFDRGRLPKQTSLASTPMNETEIDEFESEIELDEFEPGLDETYDELRFE